MPSGERGDRQLIGPDAAVELVLCNDFLLLLQAVDSVEDLSSVDGLAEIDLKSSTQEELRYGIAWQVCGFSSVSPDRLVLSLMKMPKSVPSVRKSLGHSA